MQRYILWRQRKTWKEYFGERNHLHQSESDHSSFGVIAILHSVCETSAQRHHILQTTVDLTYKPQSHVVTTTLITRVFLCININVHFHRIKKRVNSLLHIILINFHNFFKFSYAPFTLYKKLTKFSPIFA